jgi:hypothetical protein
MVIGPFGLTRRTPIDGQRHADRATRLGANTIAAMAAPPASTKTSLQQTLSTRARQRLPELAGVEVTFLGAFAFVTAGLPNCDRPGRLWSA